MYCERGVNCHAAKLHVSRKAIRQIVTAGDKLASFMEMNEIFVLLTGDRFLHLLSGVGL